MNDEDSSGESDDDIVLDQSLAANPLDATTAAPPLHVNDIPSTHAAPPQTVAQNVVAPTIVTIAPPTLKSSKNTAANVASDSNNSNTTQEPTALAPPIPFHGQQPIDREQNTANQTSLNKAEVASKSDDKAKTITNGTTKKAENSAANGDDEVVRPRVDPKLLNLMKLNNESDDTFFDLDLDGLTDKPWNSKSVDITDWFNYGFNEESWRKYCGTQIKMRDILRKQQQQKLQPQPQPPPPNPQPMTHPQRQAQQSQQMQLQSHYQQYIPRATAAQPQMPGMQTMPSAAAPSVAHFSHRAHHSSQQHSTIQMNGVCFDFKNKGKCLRGSSCRWQHQIDSHMADKTVPDGVCFEYKNKGTCMYGSQCRWKHIGHTNDQLPIGNVNGAVGIVDVGNTAAIKTETTDQLQARLQNLLGGDAPNIPSLVSNLLNDDQKTKKKKQRKKRRKHKKKRKRSKSKSPTVSSSGSRSRSRSRSRSDSSSRSSTNSQNIAK